MLREDELVESSFCRLRPGNRIELFEDYGYEELYGRLQMKSMLWGQYVSFDNIDTPYFLRVYTRTDGNTTILMTPVDQDGQVESSVILPNEATDATVTARGAEYFVGTDIGNYVVSAPEGTIEIREMGLDAPIQDSVGVEEYRPVIGGDFWMTTTIGGGMPEYTWYRNLFERLYLELDDETRLFNEMIRRFKNSLYLAPEFQALATWYPIRKVRLSAPGAAFRCGYWSTIVDEELGLESEPSNVADALLIEPNALVMEVLADVGFALEWLNTISSVQGRGDQIYIDKVVRPGLAEWIAANGTELWVQIEVPPSMVDTRISRVDVNVGNTGKSRKLYRGVLASLPKFEWEWSEDGTYSMSGFDTENAVNIVEAIEDGRRVLQGGLLKVLDAGETNYRDDRRATGTVDPTPAYPTVSFYAQGSLGVFQYLQKPPNFVVSANFGENLLLVPADNRQVIRVTPSGDPENAPPIYTLPIVSEDQDRIVAIQTLRDVAVVLTRSACLRLNYIPFESGVAQDRTLTQISDFHGAVGQKAVTTVETTEGQYVVWISRTGLMGTNGFGFRDFCPDFTLEAAGLDPSEAEGWSLVNNYREYRLELWTGSKRWDFYYHPTLLKDVRGDGLGLSFKLMGPSPYWSIDESVTAADMGDWAGEPIMLLSVTDSVGSKVMLGREIVDDRTPSIKTGQTWGSNPETMLTCHGLGLQHERRAYDVLIAVVNAGQVDTGADNFSAGALKQVASKGFSYRVPSNG